MQRITLPTFVIDTRSPGEQLSQLGDALKTHGPRLKIARVRLYTPRTAKPIRNNPDYVAKARNVRLYTHRAGIFHGTHHQLGNNLFISGLTGTLALIAGDEAKTVFMMPFRPGSQHKSSNDGLAELGKALLHHQAIPLDPEVKLFITAMESYTFATHSPDPVSAATSLPQDDPLMSLLDILRPIMGHSKPQTGPVPV